MKSSCSRKKCAVHRSMSNNNVHYLKTTAPLAAATTVMEQWECYREQRGLNSDIIQDSGYISNMAMKDAHLPPLPTRIPHFLLHFFSFLLDFGGI